MQGAWGHRFEFNRIDAPLEWMKSNEIALTCAQAPLAQIVEEFEADLLHSNQFCFGSMPLEIPKIITAHSDVLSWAKACRPEGLAKSSWLSRYCSLVQNGLSAADSVIAPTRWMLDAVREHFKFSCGMHVIPNGRRIRQLPSRPRRMQAVTAGRVWDEAKNISMLYNVSSPVPLIIAGETSFHDAKPQARSDLALYGQLSEEKLLTLFQESEIYVCSSLYEPFGLSPLEAALCGCAVLTNDIPSLREVWEDGTLYFDGPDSLAKNLTTLNQDRCLLNKVKSSSLKQAQKYSRERMCKAYLSLFESSTSQYHESANVA